MDLPKALITSLVLYAVINVISALKCLSCTGVSTLKECTTSKTCKSDEHCHARKYYSGISVLYDMDCKSTTECNIQEQRKRNVPEDGLEIDLWTSCCAKDECNTKFDTNGQLLVPAGLTCLSCSGISDPADCNVTAVCKKDEVCLTHEKFLDQGTTVFDMGCLSRKICLDLGYYLQVKKRHSKRLELCRGCCDSSDKCNNQFCSKKRGQSNVTPLGTAVIPETTSPTAAAPVTTSTASDTTTSTTMTTDSTVSSPTTTNSVPQPTTTLSLADMYHLVVEPNSVTPKVGEEAKFDCLFKPEAHENMTITWYFSELSGTKHKVYTEETDPPKLEYVISNVSMGDSGVYTCEAIYENTTWTASGTLLVIP